MFLLPEASLTSALVPFPLCVRPGACWASSPRRTCCDTWPRWWTRIQSPSCSISQREAPHSTDGVNRWNWCDATVTATCEKSPPPPDRQVPPCSDQWHNASPSFQRFKPSQGRVFADWFIHHHRHKTRCHVLPAMLGVWPSNVHSHSLSAARSNKTFEKRSHAEGKHWDWKQDLSVQAHKNV